MQNLFEKTIGEVTAWKLKCRWNDNIKLNLGELWCCCGHTELIWASCTVMINIFCESQEFLEQLRSGVWNGGKESACLIWEGRCMKYQVLTTVVRVMKLNVLWHVTDRRLPETRRQQVPAKCWYLFTRLHGITSQKTIMLHNYCLCSLPYHHGRLECWWNCLCCHS